MASSVGRNAYFVLTAWIAVDIGHRASALAILLALGSAAELLTSNVGGAVVDRFDRSIVCMICDLLRVALMVSTGVGFSFVDPLLILYISWIIFAVIDRTYSTALQAMIPSIVGAEKLESFNSASYVGMQAGNLLAAIVMGAALTAMGMDLVPVLPGACFILSVGVAGYAQPKATLLFQTARYERRHSLPRPLANDVHTSVAEGQRVYIRSDLHNGHACERARLSICDP